MLILQVKEIGDAVIATTVVGRIQYLEGDSERIVQVPFPHIVAMTQEKHLLEKVDHQIFSPKQFCMFYLVVHWSPLPLLRELEPPKYNYRFLKDCSNLMRRMNCMRR